MSLQVCKDLTVEKENEQHDYVTCPTKSTYECASDS